MSLLLKNELRLRVGPTRCEAEIWRAGLSARRSARSEVDDESSPPIPRALDQLLAAGHRLPPRAALCVEDELLYYAAFAALQPRAEAQARAEQAFDAAVEGADLLVETTLSPCGRTWIAAGIDAGLVETWQAALADRAIDLRHVRPAALEDLHALRSELPKGDSLVVMVRREGATMVLLRDACIAQIAWERCDVAATDALAERVAAVLARLSQAVHSDAPVTPPAVLLVPRDPQEHARLEPLAAARQWTLARALAGDAA